MSLLTLQLACDDLDPRFFSPPHVVEVKDKNYRRRNSLPAHIGFEPNEQKSISGATLSNVNNPTEKESDKQSKEGGKSEGVSPKRKIRSVQLPGNGGMSEIMNRVVQETNHTHYTKKEGSAGQVSARSPPLSRGPEKSHFTIRPLVCSPCLSPEKLYPKFVFTPSDRRLKDTAGSNDMPDTPPHFSLDVTEEENSCSPSAELQQQSKAEGENKEQEAVSKGVATELESDSKSLPIDQEEVSKGVATKVSKGVVTDEQDEVSKGVVTDQQDEVSKGVAAEQEKVSKGVVTDEQDEVSKGVSTNQQYEVSKGVATEQKKVPVASVHTVAKGPTHSKKVVRHVRTPSPLEETKTHTPQNVFVVKGEILSDAKHALVRRERWVSPSVSPNSPGTPQKKSEQSITEKSIVQDKLKEPNSTVHKNVSSNDDSNEVGPKVCLRKKQPHDETHQKKGVSSSASFKSEMNLMDSLTSLLNTTFNDESLMSSPENIGLVSQYRTENMIEEASVHARRRRRSSGGMPRTPHAVSDSMLGDQSLLNSKVLPHQTSTPLISPSRHEMMIQKASEHIVNTRLRRKSELLEAEGRLDAVKELSPISYSEENGEYVNQSSDNMQNETVTSHEEDGSPGEGGHRRSAKVKRHHSDRVQRRRLPSMFSWRSFRSNQRPQRLRQANVRSKS